jgi:hypothetical protein
MWGKSLEYPPEAIPTPYVLTTDRSAADEAIAVVFHVPTLPISVIRRKITKKAGQLWVAWSMECEANYPRLKDPIFMQCFDLMMTYRLDSDIPVPYIEHRFNTLLRSPPRKKDNDHLLNAFISIQYNKSMRIEYLMHLMSHMKLDSYGKVFQNKFVGRDYGRKTKLGTIRKYKFTLAFENAIAWDYVTEKFYDPLIVGSVPVYLGAPNIDEFAPGDHCFVNASEWSPEALAQYLIKLSQDETEYGKFLEWKMKPLRSDFLSRMVTVKEHVFARLCRKVEEVRNLMAGN